VDKKLIEPSSEEDISIVVQPEKLISQFKLLRDEKGFNYLRYITAVDWLSNERKKKRFEVVYQLANTRERKRISVKVFVDDGEALSTSIFLFPSANFLEREIYDLFGIKFDGHPDLRRILLSDDWEGHPLRKDYPVTGYDMWDWRAHR